MRRPLVIYDCNRSLSEFPCILGKLDFLSYQCAVVMYIGQKINQVQKQ
jgi:hypothetical protein